jgi:hypothetical protein
MAKANSVFIMGELLVVVVVLGCGMRGAFCFCRWQGAIKNGMDFG